ncbi:MAG: geranylgeranyl reductase family protein [bacterium]
MKKYDCVVVGAGPAGATAAYELVRNGLEVILLEAERLPRNKTCGGCLSARVNRLLDFDLSEVAEDEIHQGRFTYKFHGGFEVNSDRPAAYMINRDKFDYDLVKRAIQRGAVVLDKRRVARIDIEKTDLKVWADNRAYQARIVIGADGTRGIVAKSVGIRKVKTDFGLTISTQFRPSAQQLAEHQGMVHLDFGVVRFGYGWIFPKGDHLSVGVASWREKGKLLQASFDKIRAVAQKDHNPAKPQSFNATKITPGGTVLPRYHKRKYGKEKVVLVGDAAGLVDPFLGEGIYYAIKSGQMAAQAVKESLKTNKSLQSVYEELLERELLIELDAAATLAGRFYRHPFILYNLLRKSKNLQNVCLDLMLGEANYQELNSRFQALP